MPDKEIQRKIQMIFKNFYQNFYKTTGALHLKQVFKIFSKNCPK